jgi:hypothetical protein
MVTGMKRTILALFIVVAVITMTIIPAVAKSVSQEKLDDRSSQEKVDEMTKKPFKGLWDEITKIWRAIADLKTQGCKCDITRAEFDAMATKLASLEKAQECISGKTKPCGSGVGECRLGIQTCVNYHWSTDCVGEVQPSSEICDSKDNDCNGVVDDGLTQQCPLQQGVCAGATKTCTAGTWSVCDYGPNYQSVETACDNLDNDCDGLVDEDSACAGYPASCEEILSKNPEAPTSSYWIDPGTGPVQVCCDMVTAGGGRQCSKETPDCICEPPAMEGMLERHNYYRDQVGVSELVWSNQLATMAQAWADTIAPTGTLSHNPDAGVENIAAGTTSPEDTVDMWVIYEKGCYDAVTKICNTPCSTCWHYLNVISRTSTELGCGKSYSNSRWYWVCNYNY